MDTENQKDPIIKRKIGGKHLTMRASHMLPSYYEKFPFYDRALPRISKNIKEIDGYLSFIDIGANIGDTVSLITDVVDGSFLCVEGDSEYLPSLKKNLSVMKDSDISIEESFCGEDGGHETDLKVYREGGTTRLEKAKKADIHEPVRLKSLDVMIDEHRSFRKANVLKVDTDGYEIAVLHSGKKFIKSAKPVIYFEFDPELYAINNDDPLSVFKFLHDCGYDEALVYDNFGLPIKTISISDKDDIKGLSDLIDKKKIYYFDILTFHRSKKEHYRSLFENELFSSVSLLDSLFDSTKSRLDTADSVIGSTKAELASARIELGSTKAELASTNVKLAEIKSESSSRATELDVTRLELGTTKSELASTSATLNATKVQLDLKTAELTDIYHSRGWRFVMYARKALEAIMPSENIRKKILAFSYESSKKLVKVFLKIKGKVLERILLRGRNRPANTEQPKKRKVNKGSKKIVYVGHSYHNKTKSTVFLIDYLKEFYDVTVLSDESWLGKPFPDLSFVDESYLGVVFFQLLPSKKILQGIKNDNITTFPMYDHSGGLDFGFWHDYLDLKVINFSKTLHNKLANWGFETMYIQYFPEPREFSPGNIKEAFFWQRLSRLNINTIAKLFTKSDLKIHIHKAIDPGQEFIMPDKKTVAKFGITYSTWFDQREDMLNCIKQKGIYVAPREVEGIGQSFLEAMSLGKAVVAVNNPTMNEYIKDGETGYLFDLRNPKSIDLSNAEQIQKNTYAFMQNGYKEWEKNKSEVIRFIEK